MSEIIETEVKQAQEYFHNLEDGIITPDRAFSNVILKYVYKQDYHKQIVTDGKDDGGIDFLYYDEDENKITLGQAKYTNSLTPEGIVSLYHCMFQFSQSENWKESHSSFEILLQ